MMVFRRPAVSVSVLSMHHSRRAAMTPSVTKLQRRSIRSGPYFSSRLCSLTYDGEDQVQRPEHFAATARRCFYVSFSSLSSSSPPPSLLSLALPASVSARRAAGARTTTPWCSNNSSFSSSFSSSMEASQRLVEILKREFAEEMMEASASVETMKNNNNSSHMDEVNNNTSSTTSTTTGTTPESELAHVQAKLEKDGWTVVQPVPSSSSAAAANAAANANATAGTGPASAITELVRTIAVAEHNNATLQVKVMFHCQDQVEEPEPAEDEEEPGEEPEKNEDVADEEEEEEEAMEDEDLESQLRLTVTVGKSHHDRMMVFHCLCDADGIVIEEVTVTSSAAKTVLTSTIDAHEYQGPVFSELAQDLQDAYLDFLVDDVGLGEDMAKFVTLSATQREQSEYVKFLKDCQTILSP